MSNTSFDIDWVRAQFPALAQQIDGAPVAFLDGPGGTQVPRSVIDAISDYLIRSNANCGGTFEASLRSDAVLISAREAMADLLGCRRDEIVFGLNMTSLTFATSRALARDWHAGDEVIVTTLDHDANVAPWRALTERGVVIRQVDVHVEDCTLDLSDLSLQLSSRTRLVAVGYASNAVGTINPVAKIVQMSHSVGALVYVDAVHYAPHGAIDVKALGCDFLACSAYKFFGPHLGVLYGKAEHLETFKPYKVRPAHECIPDCWETGTQSHELIAALPATVDYIAQIGQRATPDAKTRRAALMSAFRSTARYERSLLRTLIDGLAQIPGVRLLGINDRERLEERCSTVAIRFDRHRPRDVAGALAERAISVWDGNFYALNLTERLGVEGSGGLLRIGLVHYNTQHEVHRLVQALQDIVGR